jgi:flagellar biogenesis protein FliO
VLAWLVRKGTLQLPGSRSKTPVRVEAVTPLGDRRSLVIVAVEGRRLLLGLTPAQVSFVTELGHQPPDFGAALDAMVTPARVDPS